MWKSCFRSSRLKTNVFEKLLNSFSCISFMKLFGLSVFYINFCYFSKILFSRILINQTCFLINWKSLVFQGLVSLVRLVLDWYSNDRISKGMKKKKEEAFSPHVFFTFWNIFLSFSSFSLSTDPIQVFLVIFLLKSSRVFVFKYR